MRIENRTRHVFLAGVVVVASALSGPAAHAADESYSAVTTANPKVPVDQLQLLVKPLTKDELVVEADAWLGLLKAKITELTQAEIAVKRKRQEIKKVEEFAAAAQEAKQLADQATEVQAKAQATGDAAAVKEAEKAAGAAQAAAGKAKKVAEETVKQQEEEAAGQVGQQAGPPGKKDVADAATIQDQQATAAAKRALTADVNDMDEAAKAAKKAAEAKAEARISLVEAVGELRAQRTALIDRMNVVSTLR